MWRHLPLPRPSLASPQPWAGRAQSLLICRWCWCSPRAYTWPASRTVVSSPIAFHDQICVSSTNLSSEFQNCVGTIYHMTLDRCPMGTWTQHAPTTSPPINSFASVFLTHPHTQTGNQHQPTSNPQSIQLPITVYPFHLRNVSFVCPPHSLSPDTTIVQAHITHWDNYTSCVLAFPASRLSPPLCGLHTAVTVMS